MTSPSWPVSTSPPLPAIDAASTKRTSPPAPVTARPVATPGTRGARRDLLVEPRPPQRLQHGGGVDDHRLRLIAGGDPRGRLAQHGAQLALQLADARLARVVGDDEPQHVGVDRDVVRAQAVPLHLARPQVVARDGHLLVGRVAVEPDHLHPVEQRPGDRVRHVGGGQEQHLGQVELHVEVVVLEAHGSARGRAPRAAPPTDRRASPPPACPPRRAGSRGSWCPRPAARAPAGRAGRRCRCGGGRGSRPRRARRPGTCGRTSGRWRGRSTRRSTSCRSPEGRSGSGWRPTGGRR